MNNQVLEPLIRTQVIQTGIDRQIGNPSGPLLHSAREPFERLIEIAKDSMDHTDLIREKTLPSS